MSTETLQTLTINEAMEYVPAIGATGPAAKVSDRYQFISTRGILERVEQEGWRITNATSQGRSPYAQHRITLVHEDQLSKLQSFHDPAQIEGIPRIEMFNSHNLTKRLMFAIGFFRFVCSNGLIVATGPAETIRTKHRFSDDRFTQIMDQVSEISQRFPIINEKINDFKSRELTEQEQYSFAKYAITGRFIYRPAMPKRFQNLDRTAERLLAHRREEDNGNSTWQVFNRVQENLIMGMEGFSRPIRGYTDSTKINQLLWKGAETTLSFNKDNLNKALMELLIKDKKKGKIAA